MQAADRDKPGEPEQQKDNKATKTDLIEAEEWARKFLARPLTRPVESNKGFTHRTMVKVNQGKSYNLEPNYTYTISRL